MQTVQKRNFVIAGRNQEKLNWIPAQPDLPLIFLSFSKRSVLSFFPF